jgi:hypothetical protein
LRYRHLLLAFALASLALSPVVHAVTPPPDGGYPFNNTAEGTDALFELTQGTGDAIGGIGNTAIGFQAL